MFKNHKKIERNVFILLILTIIVTAIGGMVQIFPLFIKEVTIERVEGMRAYTPLELAGFYIYKQEGCYNCHSQQIRPLRDEFERYGHYSLAVESMYDHPFQWGSKRTGPDLARVGNKYSDDWHIEHLIDPRSIVSVSVMPGYPHLQSKLLDITFLQKRMSILQMLGVPYSAEDVANCDCDIKVQLGFEQDASLIERFNSSYNNPPIRKFNNKTEEITEMDAIIAYLQTLGIKVDVKTNQGRNW